jgi:hypothetical protein
MGLETHVADEAKTTTMQAISKVSIKFWLLLSSLNIKKL